MFDRDSIELPEVQEKLVQALHATGKPMVMVNCSGSAIALPWEDRTSAGDSAGLVSGRGRRTRRGGSSFRRGEPFRPSAGDLLPGNGGLAVLSRIIP